MIRKKFLKGKCRVTFELSDGLQDAEDVQLVGDFNDWNKQATPLDRTAGHKFRKSLDLEPNHEYQFRYLVDGHDWHNDEDADKYVPNPYNGDNSVVSTFRTP